MVGVGRRLRLHGAAREGISAAARDHETARDGLGSEFVISIDTALARIAKAPQRWPLVLGAHRYVMRRFPYNVFYRVSAEEVYVVAVAHQRQRPGYWRRRR